MERRLFSKGGSSSSSFLTSNILSKTALPKRGFFKVQSKATVERSQVMMMAAQVNKIFGPSAQLRFFSTEAAPEGPTDEQKVSF